MSEFPIECILVFAKHAFKYLSVTYNDTVTYSKLQLDNPMSSELKMPVKKNIAELYTCEKGTIPSSR